MWLHGTIQLDEGCSCIVHDKQFKLCFLIFKPKWHPMFAPPPVLLQPNGWCIRSERISSFFMIKSICGGAVETQRVWKIENVHTMLLSAESDMCSWISANTGGCSWVASGVSPCGSVAALTPKVWNGAGQTEFCKRSAALWWHVEAAESTTVTQNRKQQRFLHDDRRLVCFFSSPTSLRSRITSCRFGVVCVFWAPRCGIGFGHPAKAAQSSWREETNLGSCF